VWLRPRAARGRLAPRPGVASLCLTGVPLPYRFYLPDDVRVLGGNVLLFAGVFFQIIQF